jgi:putative zinc finger/helix-turn-helix YgiT family protein
MRCPTCGGPLSTRTLPTYQDDRRLGLPGVIIEDAVQEHRCARCGESGTAFENLGGLLAAAGLIRILKPAKLRGPEIRFLRKQLDWTQPVMAERLGVREEAVSRWENGHEIMATSTEKYFRTVVGRHLTESERAPLVEFDPRVIEEMRLRAVTDRPVTIRLRLVRAARRQWQWEASEAA